MTIRSGLGRQCLLFSILIVIAAHAQAAPIAIFSTGVDGTGTVLADGTADPHYTVTPAPDPLGPFARTSAGAYPIPPWLADSVASAWITPTTFDSNLSGIYTFRTTFDLTGLDHTTALITGQWAADDIGVDIEINGIGTGQGFTPPPPGFVAYRNFSITSNFVSGMNTLDFIVNDTGVIGGLRVEIQRAEADPIPEPATLALMGLGLAGAGYQRRRKASS